LVDRIVPDCRRTFDPTLFIVAIGIEAEPSPRPYERSARIEAEHEERARHPFRRSRRRSRPGVRDPRDRQGLAPLAVEPADAPATALFASFRQQVANPE
jgi:hypothetical protein